MMIVIDDTFYVDTDAHNYILKEQYIGKSRSGEPKEYTRTEGYYPSLKHVLKRVRHIYIDRNESTVSIDRYIQQLVEIEEKYGGIS